MRLAVQTRPKWRRVRRKMELSIIIVNWNSACHVRNCLRSILAHTRDLDYEIIVIDAGSFDGCGEMLGREFPQARFIQNQSNCGFVRANNIAYSASRGESILFLNPDTELLGPAVNLLHEQIQALPTAGALGCKLLNSDRTVQISCVQSFPTILNQFLDSEFLRARWPKSVLWGTAPLFSQAEGPKEVETISGACMMLKRETFEKVGMFSQDYYMYAEDVDLCHKLRQAGYTNYYLPTATIVHHGGSSSQSAPGNFSVVMMRESIWRFFCKTRGKVYGCGFRCAMLAAAFMRLLLLGLLFPVRTAMRRGTGGVASLRKWWFVLRWSLWRETWVKDF